MRKQEAIDLDAGRIRLADLDSDDEYTGGRRGRKKKTKRKKGKKNRQTYATSSEEEYEDECDMEETVEIAADLTEDAALNVEHDAANNIMDETLFAQQCVALDESNSSEEEEPTSWRCECCRKDFKSEKQFDNHIKSKKHKEMLKKYEKKLQMNAVDCHAR